MSDRYFPNSMPDTGDADADSRTNLLSMDYASLSAFLQQRALNIKETVAAEMWAARKVGRVREFEVYSGVLGTALLGLKSYLVTGNGKDLELCDEIVRACDAGSAAHSRDLVTFICGRAGVCALGAVVAKYAGNDELLRYYLTQFRKIQLPKSLPDELLYGRAGYLWACLYINKHIGPETIPSSSMRVVVAEIIENGRRMPNKGRWPLMYEWYGERYWGAAHGLAGIMHVLMECNLTAAERQDVRSTLGCMIQNRFPSGNYPASEEDRRCDLLVHWCHGAPGIALTLIKAYEIDGGIHVGPTNESCGDAPK